MKEKLTMTPVFATKPSKKLLAYFAKSPAFLACLEEVAAGRARFMMRVRHGEKTKRQKW